ncbi:hypothetical protein [Mesonia aestuariivivens]|uniref:LPXTG cell wall anchor domain-containing protein n=1 Tax=Mesonia aestuariivivens TaxID=2796128 RepID=A0ABS6VYU2_9FLAO|nr:hypothetical protein [Mesonia aestuariivivens]MBW2960431.1 hypothetical protein [Mesonia aestuariivivens]
MKFFKYFEYAYLVFALLFFFESYRIWGESESRGYLCIFLGFVAAFMYFFKRRFRKKLEERTKR